MTDETLKQIRTWFETYAKDFLSKAPDPSPRRTMMALKLAHSRRVAADTRGIALDLGWDLGDQNTAEALGWLHDTGRFSQMAEFGTFRDGDSVNHGKRGHEVLGQSGILRNCSARRARQILDSILHHNVLQVPDDVHPDSLAFVHLIRDADKLDIFHIFSDAIIHQRLNDYPEITHHVDLNGPPSPEIMRELRAQRVPGYRQVRSLTDWMLLQVSWVYDLNYPPACRRAKTRGVISTLAGLLPKTAEIDEIISQACIYLDERCKKTASY